MRSGRGRWLRRVAGAIVQTFGQRARGINEQVGVLSEIELVVWVGDDDEIKPGGQVALAKSKGLAKEPLEAVTGDGAADAFADRQPEARQGWVGGVEDGVNAERPAIDGALGRVRRGELAGVRQSLRAIEAQAGVGWWRVAHEGS
jgi:hypothetical protein